jgi:hypothetical protein
MCAKNDEPLPHIRSSLEKLAYENVVDNNDDALAEMNALWEQQLEGNSEDRKPPACTTFHDNKDLLGAADLIGMDSDPELEHLAANNVIDLMTEA